MKTRENIQLTSVLAIMAGITFFAGFYNPFHFTSGIMLGILSRVIYKHW